MKKALCVLAAAFLLCVLPGCGCGDGIEADLVFVNDSDAVIVAVAADFQDRNGGTQNADSSPLQRGETFGFEAGEYPVTVYVYDRPVYDIVEGALARITIAEAPPEGERWYVAARDGAGGLTLTAGTRLPDAGGGR